MTIKSVKLVSWRTIDVLISGVDELHSELFCDGEPIAIRQIAKTKSVITYFIDEWRELVGHELKLKTAECGDFIVNVSEAIDFDDFDMHYFYGGDDLGATYHYDHTSFKLWAPLAYKVFLVINDNEVSMRREEHGVYSAYLDGNFDGATYKYVIFLNGKQIETIDPYGKSSTSNGRLSAVINPEKLEMDMFDECLPKMDSYLDAIIYEANVRDMTSDPTTDIENKGKFLGLIEKDRKTEGGNPAGFDYLSQLGFTHLQLMPVLDFQTVNEDDPSNGYNWGYDPMQIFALEGSYSTNPNNPYSRMIEFKKLVRSFHKVGIRINLDIVFNHIYEVKQSIFEKITPGYYFRRDDNGYFMNHSYCGNEFASERPMVRKMFVDSLKFLVSEYHVDGFRFDLMGLLDVDTMNEISRVTKSIRPDIMLYGEGWDMCSETSDGTPLANMYNEDLIPDYAFFNDRFRNIVRGSGGGAKLDENGYLLGNTSYRAGFEFVFGASCYDRYFPQLFEQIDSSLNYVECHDNATLYDAIVTSTDIDDPLRLIRKINWTIMLSFGIPFFHAGQEIGATKNKHHNTYNEGDRLNHFSYQLLDQNLESSLAFKTALSARKEIQLYKSLDRDLIEERMVICLDKECFHAKIVDIDKNETTYHIFINPTSRGVRIKFDRDVEYYVPPKYRVIKERPRTRNADVSAYQISIFVECKD